ncbi:hypothetical protein ACFSCX_07825 [Bacillus salitolerans]|uniref:Atypical membrane-integrating protein (Mistic protein) n=1 Tax=Bacillus salitolerans TaxID=1437434 RepID=A0ABW4LN12_9BACI
MKVNDQEKQTLSDAIDKMNEGLDAFIQLYNEAEEDRPLIQFSDEVTEIIGRVKNIYGDKEIDDRINKLVKEILSLLPLDQASNKGQKDEA